MFGTQDELAFFRMYCETFRVIKALSPRIQVGAPPMTFMNQESIAWARRFFGWEKEQGIVPDFFCAQYYSVVWPNRSRSTCTPGSRITWSPHTSGDFQFP